MSNDREGSRDACEHTQSTAREGGGAPSYRPRRPSPLGGRKPTTADLPEFAVDDPDSIDDLLPIPELPLRMLIVGVNPGLWTAAVNAPFARPGNRFWPSLHAAELTPRRVDAGTGLDDEDAEAFVRAGMGLTNLVGRATTRADELTAEELRAGGHRLVERISGPDPELRPRVVAIAGITAYRTAFGDKKARLGRQDTAGIEGWPDGIELWVVPQPSGLNAHENIDSLAAKWKEVWEASK
ncbi:mismatch-specific DNA-glycosylase [Dietzia sp.]|uniref:mismatch-specific DNA-glycosylase n=1 Tax=Dietzia sp. TaxID=1871616 RepID=UPI002FDA87F4